MKSRIGFSLTALVAVALLAGSTSAAVHVVNQNGLTFDPAELTIDVGDTVEWRWASGSHTVTSGIDTNDPDVGSLFDEPLTSANSVVSYTFTTPGEVPYFCRPHLALGMTGLIRVTTGVTHTVEQVGLTFSPANIDINVGDTVRWVWNTGSHTVTNGVDLADPEVATLFDAPLTAADPSFSYTFFAIGAVPYFCRPHLGAGMTGTVNVQDASPVFDLPNRAGYALHQNSPNPFNPQTVIGFELPQPGTVRLEIFDLGGRLVRVLLDGVTVDAGPGQAVWNGTDDTQRPAPAGVYFYRLTADDFHLTRSMALVK